MSVSIILQSITTKRDGKGGSFYVYYYFPKRKWPKVQCEKLLKKVEHFFLSRGCFCGRLEFKTKYNAAGEISTKSSGRDV